MNSRRDSDFSSEKEGFSEELLENAPKDIKVRLCNLNFNIK
jgi:hypothetical protein